MVIQNMLAKIWLVIIAIEVSNVVGWQWCIKCNYDIVLNISTNSKYNGIYDYMNTIHTLWKC